MRRRLCRQQQHRHEAGRRTAAARRRINHARSRPRGGVSRSHSRSNARRSHSRGPARTFVRPAAHFHRRAYRPEAPARRSRLPGRARRHIGGLRGSGFEFEITLSPYAAGIERITLAEHTRDAGKPDPYPLQSAPRDASGAVIATALATLGVELTIGSSPPEFVDLRTSSAGAVWRATAPGAFTAEILDADSQRPVARLEKTFVIAPGSYDIRVNQRLLNLSGEPMAVRWYQYGPMDLPPESSGYGIDVRRLRWGSLRNAQQDPSRQFVEGDTRLTGHRTLADPLNVWDRVIWPNDDTTKQGRELVWLALTSRYFAFAVHPLIDVSAAAPDKRMTALETAHRVLLRPASGPEAIALQLNSPQLAVAPGAALDMSLGAYAGPLRQSILAQPEHIALGLNNLIVYNLGGPCAPCTFPAVASGLIWFLRLVHDHLLFDWSLAIMVLVLAVRTTLHPITRRSQIGLARFSKQMQALAPKQQAIREKFKDSPKQMQAEIARLMREEGVNFRGALGCLPIFLQMPVWIALYAMLFFAFELRHTPGFFGVFQALSGGRWSFLEDLSAPDHFIEFGQGFHIPLVSGLMGPVTGVNILPLILGVVFFIQQKYLTPAASTALTPEQELQQKMMKWMMVILFPLMMFNAPSGLAIYFITNSTLGIIESRWIRKHIDSLSPPTPGAGGGGAAPRGKPPKLPEGPAGFWQRVQHEAMRRAEQKRGQSTGQRPGQPKRTPPGGSGKPRGR